MPVHNAVARNFAEASENKIHSDDIAKRFGFTGALVPGVTVFGSPRVAADAAFRRTLAARQLGDHALHQARLSFGNDLADGS